MPAVISAMHQKCMHISSNYIHTRSHKAEMLSHAGHQPGRLSGSVKGRQHRQAYAIRATGDLLLHLCNAQSWHPDSDSDGLEMQPPESGLGDHLKPDLTL